MLTFFAPPAPSLTQPAKGYGSPLEPPGFAAMKRLVWIYFWLLIFEGALRKWVLPGLSNPLLLIRDPVVILIYITAGMAGLFPRNGLVTFTIILGVVSFGASELFGSGNLLVSLYGFRTAFLHLPLIFILPSALDRKDVIKMMRWILIAAIPMFLLVLVQFRASPDAWINNGAGGGVGAQLTVGFGKIRPPGTFSFTAGLASFLCATAAIAICVQMRKELVPPRLATASLIATAGIALISGSRTALGGLTLVMLAVAFVSIQKPKLAGSGIRATIVLAVILSAFAFSSEFRTGIEIHQSRLENGGGLKDGIFFRTLDGLLEPLSAAANSNFFGAGLGMGTNAASSFVDGEVNFRLGEGDWGRTVREMGGLLGFLHIGLRIGLIVFLARHAFASLQRENPLPILLFAAVFSDLLNGQFGVPSLLGLAVFKGGLCLAATNLDPVPVSNSAAELEQSADLVLPSLPGFRGRSVYAEQLHGEAENPFTQRFGP